MANDPKLDELAKEWERRFAALPPQDRAHLDQIPEAERSFAEADPRESEPRRSAK